MAAKMRYNVFLTTIKILEFAGFRKSQSIKRRKPGIVSHDDLLEIGQTEHLLHNNCVLLTHLQDACCDIVYCVFADISVNWRTTISLLATLTRSGEIMTKFLLFFVYVPVFSIPYFELCNENKLKPLLDEELGLASVSPDDGFSNHVQQQCYHLTSDKVSPAKGCKCSSTVAIWHTSDKKVVVIS